METYIPAIPLTRTQGGVFTLASIVKQDHLQEKRRSRECLTRIYDILLWAERTWYMYPFLQTDSLVAVLSICSCQNGRGGYMDTGKSWVWSCRKLYRENWRTSVISVTYKVNFFVVSNVIKRTHARTNTHTNTHVPVTHPYTRTHAFGIFGNTAASSAEVEAWWHYQCA